MVCLKILGAPSKQLSQLCFGDMWPLIVATVEGSNPLFVMRHLEWKGHDDQKCLTLAMNLFPGDTPSGVKAFNLKR